MRILLTGATGFVGQHLYLALEASGCQVISGSRDPERALRRMPGREWVQLDVEDYESTKNALRGCDAAFYLIHGMGQGGDFPQREAKSATHFAKAAKANGVDRVIYLGGVLPPPGEMTKHLGSRRKTGEILRAHGPTTIEMRAAMIIGNGSVSWMMVKDLAARLPFMLLPSWLRNHSYPIAIDDVIWGLLAALFESAPESQVYELPGPERISHRDVLSRVAALLGHHRPSINVPVLSPRISSYWIALVTRVSLPLAKELVEGVRFNLDPQEKIFWDIVQRKPMSLEEAAKYLISETDFDGTPSPAATVRLRDIGRQFKENVI